MFDIADNTIVPAIEYWDIYTLRNSLSCMINLDSKADLEDRKLYRNRV